MSSTHTITLLKPDGTGSLTAYPKSLDLNLQTEDFGTLVATFDAQYSSVTADYENGKITYSRNAGSAQTLFVGKILKVERWQEHGKQMVRLQCADPKSALDATIAGRGSSNYVSTSTEQIVIADHGLDTDGIPVSSDGFYRYFPDADVTNSAPSSSTPWIAIDSTDYAPQALCDSTINASATEIPTQSTSDQGFPPRGIIWISNNYTSANEYVWYDGYAPDPSNSDKYTFYNCVRGVLSTTAASHFINHKIGYRAVKPIDVETLFNVEGFKSSAWHEIDPGLFRFNSELGTIEFSGDLTASPYSYTDFRYTATHYDVDSATAETLETLIQGLMEYPKANGGMGLTVTTEFTIDIPRIPLLEDVGNDSAMYMRDMLDLLLRTYEPYAFGTKGLGYWYNPTNALFEFQAYAQAGSADVDLSSIKASKINQKNNSADQYSSVLVQYTPARANLNLLSADRIWHPARGDTVGGQTLTGYNYMYADLANAAGWLSDSSSTGNNVYGYALVDGNPNTGAGLYFNDNPTAFYAFDLWFPNADTYIIDWVSFTLDLRNFLPPGTIANISLVGWESYTPGTPPTRSGAFTLTGYSLKNGGENPMSAPYGQPIAGGGGGFGSGGGIV